MSRTTQRRRRREAADQMSKAYEAATVDVLRAIDGRRHPDAYSPTQLRKMIVADIRSGIHGTSQPHLWFMARGVGNIASAERKSSEAVTQEILLQAESERPGATL